DNDSCALSDSRLDEVSQMCRVIKLNPVKDATDTEECCNYVMNNGFDSVLLLGAIGTRFDHTLANVYLLRRFADKGLDAKIADEHNVIFFAKKHNFIDKSVYNNVSVIPVEGDVSDISNKGFGYPLNGERLEMYSSRGVSNYLAADRGEITVKEGRALIILSRD
ncbi:MAG: thiamine diphosphokinase, partial [Clostridia bacterium]|nr:thiamine diphosphokinase [Clostridia bacterium]